MLVNLNRLLPLAYREKYAVPHFNFSDLEVAQGIVSAAAEARSPVILGTSESAIRYAGIDNLVAIAKNLARDYPTVPIVLHLDHGKSFEVCKRAVEAGYTSVMIDGSRLNFQKNLQLTKRVVDLAHRHRLSVEAELGAVGADVRLPSASQASEFVEKSGIDALAPALGTAHGLPVKNEHIHFDVLEAIEKEIGVPLVLHGASNLPLDQIKKAIKMGISKVNIDTELRQAFTKEVRSDLTKKTVIDPREYLGAGREGVKKAVLQKIDQVGSRGKI